MSWIEGEWNLGLFRNKPGWHMVLFWDALMQNEWVNHWNWRDGGLYCKMQHSRVNEIHHDLSEYFVRFSTCASGHRPGTIYLEARPSLWKLRGTLVSLLSSLGETFLHVVHTLTHTHQQLPQWSKDRHYASHPLATWNEGTVKTKAKIEPFAFSFFFLNASNVLLCKDSCLL